MKKVFLVVVFLCAVAQAQVGNEWNKVENPINSIKYRKNLSKMFPHLINRNMGRITGGQYAIHQQLPYQVLLKLDSQDVCGGSIISQNWILTAAHWFDI